MHFAVEVLYVYINLKVFTSYLDRLDESESHLCRRCNIKSFKGFIVSSSIFMMEVGKRYIQVRDGAGICAT